MKKLNKSYDLLVNDLIFLIEENRKKLAATANAVLTITYWQVGKRINKDFLDNKRAEYGKQIVVSVARHLTSRYGKSFEEKNLRRMMQFAQVFDDRKIVVSLIRQLS